jgi:predicted small lipoprotein YifL
MTPETMPRRSSIVFAGLIVCLAALTGCGKTPPAFFRPNMVEATKQRLTPDQEKQVATILLAMFGTPDEPVCLPETGLDEARLRLAELAPMMNDNGNFVRLIEQRTAGLAPQPAQPTLGCG